MAKGGGGDRYAEAAELWVTVALGAPDGKYVGELKSSGIGHIVPIE